MNRPKSAPDAYHIIFFDGVCNLCNSSVDFIIKRDKNKVFRYASLQSALGQVVLQRQRLSSVEYGSFLLSENGIVYKESTAALRVTRKLSGLWPVLFIFIVVPPFIRNAVYRIIARNRYKWFGKKETCRLPSPEERALFVS